MNPITENPYRILGLLAGCSEKDLLRQVTKISRYDDVGKSVSFDFDFKFLGDLRRDLDAVKDATSSLEQSILKVHWALFWFVKANHIDETALNHLKERNPQKASEIWNLPIKDREITARNYSAALNLSTLQFAISIQNGKLDSVLFKKAIRLKGKVVSTEGFDTLIELITHERRSGIRDAVMKEFVDSTVQTVRPFLDKKDGITTRQLFSAFRTFPEECSAYLKSKFTDAPVRRVEKEVEAAQKVRLENPGNAGICGEQLFQKTRDDLKILRNVLVERSVQFQMLNNKVADEVLRCSIAYFNEFHDSEDIDPGSLALKLAQFVRQMEPTGEVKHRLEENMSVIQEWVADEPERKKQKQIGPDIEFVTRRLVIFQDLRPSTLNARNLLTETRPKLENIGRLLGRTDDLYLKISGAVVGNSIGMAISIVNEAQRNYSYLGDGEGFRKTVGQTYELIKMAEFFDFGTEQRQSLRRNKETLVELMSNLGMGVTKSSQVQPVTRKPTMSPNPGISSLSSGKSKNGNTLSLSAPRILGALFLLMVIAVLVSVFYRNPDSQGPSKSATAPSLPAGMVSVPGGTIRIGRLGSKYPVESPPNPVTVKPFFMDVYETTNMEYSEFLTSTNHPKPPVWKSITAAQAKLPVVGVTWDDATAYAKWKGKRLPTEQEWEFAARGTELNLYPWGADWIPGYSNSNGSNKGLTQIGAFPKGASVYGIHDLSGNAWEWTASDFKAYPGGSLPAEFNDGKNLKTIRGGGFSSEKDFATTTYRIGWPAGGAKDYSLTGFRCVKDVEVGAK